MTDADKLHSFLYICESSVALYLKSEDTSDPFKKLPDYSLQGLRKFNRWPLCDTQNFLSLS